MGYEKLRLDWLVVVLGKINEIVLKKVQVQKFQGWVRKKIVSQKVGWYIFAL